MKRVYKSKTVMVGGTKIKVRQVLFKGKKGVADRVGRYVGTARMWLNQVLPELVTANMRDTTEQAFTDCFLADPTSARVMTAKSTLMTIKRHIDGPLGVKVRKDDSAYGYVSQRYGGRRHRVDGMVFYDDEGDEIRSQGEVHIDVETVEANPTLAVITLIHEAGHKFCNLEDFGDQGYFKDDYSDYISPGLTWQNALRNADSYAFFVYKTLLGKFHSVVVT